MKKSYRTGRYRVNTYPSIGASDYIILLRNRNRNRQDDSSHVGTQRGKYYDNGTENVPWAVTKIPSLKRMQKALSNGFEI